MNVPKWRACLESALTEIKAQELRRKAEPVWTEASCPPSGFLLLSHGPWIADELVYLAPAPNPNTTDNKL